MSRNPFARIVTTLALGGLLLLAGCASGGGGGSSGGGVATLTVVNGSNETIFRIHMSPSRQSNWGPDHLGSNVLTRGSSFNLTNIAPGTWDIRVVDRSGNSKEFRNQTFRGGRTYTLRVNTQGWSRS